MPAKEIVEYYLRLSGNLPADAERAADAIEHAGRAADRGTKAIEKLGQIGGGALGQLAGDAADFGDALEFASDSLGAVGLGLVAGTAAVGGFAIGTQKLAEAASTAFDRLEKAGLAGEIPAETIASVTAYKTSVADLRTEIDLLTVEAGGPALRAISGLAEAAAGGIEEWIVFRDTATGLREAIEEFGVPLSTLESGLNRVGTAFITLGLSIPLERLEGYLSSIGRSTDETRKLVDEVDRLGQALLTFQPPSMSQPLPEGWAGALANEPGRGRAPTSNAPSAETMAEWGKLATTIIAEGNSAADQQVRTDAGLKIVDALNASADSWNADTFALINQLREESDAAGRLTTVMDANLRAAERASIEQTKGVADTIVRTITSVLDLPRAFNDAIKAIPAQLADAIGNTIQLYGDTIPDAIAKIGQYLPDYLVKAFPKIALEFATLGPRMALGFTEAFVKGIERLFTVDFWRDAGRSFADSLKDALGDFLNPFKSSGALGTDLTPAKGESARFLGIKLPHFDTAMERPVTLTQTGLAVVHRGEEIRRAGSATVLGGGGGGPTIVVNGPLVGGPSAAQELARLLQREIGGYGTGASLSPLVR